MSDRRTFLAGAAATALAGSSWGAQRAAPKDNLHFINGGLNGITRSRYSLTATSTIAGIGAITLPKANVVYLLPLTVTDFTESADVVLQTNNQVMINTTGFYRVSISIDWPGQQGVDLDLRYVGIGRLVVGASPIIPLDGVLTPIIVPVDKLATLDVPGSNPPQYTRSQVTWAPGSIAPGSYAYIDVTMPDKGIVAPGDVVQVGHTSLTDAVLGLAGNLALRLEGRVVKKDTVRVVLSNSFGSAAINVPSGTLDIIAGSATLTRGESADAWNVLQTNTQMLLAGEQVFGAIKSKATGDYMQVSGESFFQIERVG